ncbi:nudix hydrolase 12, mitochondrial-like isoform X2 [Wolffia australiana]
METVALESRTGRERQLYEDGCRLVAGCVPYKAKPGVVLSQLKKKKVEDSIVVLMISSPNRKDLVFPKGGWEKDETVYEAAKREALEEAGIRGTIHARFLTHVLSSLALMREKKLGIWESRSKSSEISRSPLSKCRCHFFAMKVEEELDSWSEQPYHKRRWVSAWVSQSYLSLSSWVRERMTNGTEPGTSSLEPETGTRRNGKPCVCRGGHGALPVPLDEGGSAEVPGVP